MPLETPRTALEMAAERTIADAVTGGRAQRPGSRS